MPAAALAQKASLTNFGLTAVATFGTATTANRLLTCEVQSQQATDVTGITDSAGNTWVKAESLFNTSQKHAETWYALNAASVTTVTVTAGGTSVNINGSVQEWTNSANFILRDHASASRSSSATPTAATVNVKAGDVVVGCLTYLEAVSGTRQDTLATGTQLDALARGTTAFNSAYKIAAADGTDAPSWTFSPAVSCVEVTASFGPPLANVAPTANAGPDQLAEPYDTITLTSAASTDSDGTIVSRLWTQTGGVTTALSDPTAVSPTLTAPAVITGTTLTYSLVVTDNLGADSSADTVSVTVAPHTIWSKNSGGVLKPVRVTKL